MITEEEFLKIISKTLNENYSKVTLNSKHSDFKNWDSLSNIRIILELEKKTKKRLINLSNFENLYELYDDIKKV